MLSYVFPSIRWALPRILRIPPHILLYTTHVVFSPRFVWWWWLNPELLVCESQYRDSSRCWPSLAQEGGQDFYFYDFINKQIHTFSHSYFYERGRRHLEREKENRVGNVQRHSDKWFIEDHDWRVPRPLRHSGRTVWARQQVCNPSAMVVQFCIFWRHHYPLCELWLMRARANQSEGHYRELLYRQCQLLWFCGRCAIINSLFTAQTLPLDTFRGIVAGDHVKREAERELFDTEWTCFLPHIFDYDRITCIGRTLFNRQRNNSSVYHFQNLFWTLKTISMSYWYSHEFFC